MAKSANYNWTTYEDGTTVINFQDDISNFIKDVDNMFSSLFGGGTVYQASLQNGWGGTLKYSKNDLGQVTVRGECTVGVTTVNATIAQLPWDYSPFEDRVGIPTLHRETGRAGIYLWIDASSTRRGEIRIANDLGHVSTGDTFHFNITFSTS